MTFIRCELACRIYSQLREMGRADFVTGQIIRKERDLIKSDASIRELCQQMKQFHELLAQHKLPPMHCYWIFSQS